MKRALSELGLTMRCALAGALIAWALPSAWAAQGATAAAGADPQVCKDCHEPQVKSFTDSRHGTRSDSRTPANNGNCLVCHRGDAAAHVKAGGGKGVGNMVSLSSKTISAEEKNSSCLSCHQGDSQRVNWKSSTHGTRDVACTSCHQVHASRDRVRDKVTQTEVCFTCHKEQRAQINKPSRHPVQEGKVSCSDCHNVHNNNPKQMARGSVVETCYTCHMEKRGPFVHNHQPVTEDCTICHQPHGSTIAGMLKSRPPYLCQDCHASSGHPTQAAGIPTGRTTSTSSLGTVARGCLNCHTNIHGSNSTQNSATAGRFRR